MPRASSGRRRSARVARSNPGASNFGRVRNGHYPAGKFTTSVDGDGSILLTFIPAPRIRSITGAGTTSVTVTWSNAVPGLTYVLQYNTNLSTRNWYDLPPVSASSSIASQTDTVPAGSRQCYYRVRIQ